MEIRIVIEDRKLEELKTMVKSFATRLANRRTFVALTALMMVVPLVLVAGELNTFVDGQIIHADPVNENFEDLDGRLETYESAIHVDGETGNVGIGTTNPGENFEVSDVNDTGIKITASSYSHRFQVTNSGRFTGSGPVGPWLDVHRTSDTEGSIVFNEDGLDYGFRVESSDDDAAFVIDNTSGKVGIGTTEPLEKLDVVGAIRFNGNETYHSNITSAGMIDFSDAFNGIRIFSYGANASTRGTIAFVQAGQNNALAQYSMLIDAAGNVGIGTTTPRGTLDVNGSIYQRGGQLYADHVFAPDYALETIEAHSEAMWRERHLPAVPAARFDEDGQEILEVGTYRLGMMEELEKAHVYIEQLNDRARDQDGLIFAQQQVIEDQQEALSRQQEALSRQQAEIDHLRTKVTELSGMEARLARLEARLRGGE